MEDDRQHVSGHPEQGEPNTRLQTGAEKTARRKCTRESKEMQNIHHRGKEIAARQDQERTRADNIKLRNQQKPP